MSELSELDHLRFPWAYTLCVPTNLLNPESATSFVTLWIEHKALSPTYAL